MSEVEAGESGLPYGATRGRTSTASVPQGTQAALRSLGTGFPLTRTPAERTQGSR